MFWILKVIYSERLWQEYQIARGEKYHKSCNFFNFSGILHYLKKILHNERFDHDISNTFLIFLTFVNMCYHF